MLQSNTLRRSTLAVLAATLSVAMVACNPPKAPTATVTGVTIAPTTASVAVNATTTLKATVTGANNPAQTVTWKSSSDAIAMVSAAGVVTGKTAGKATITACSTLASTKCGTAEVTVTAGTGGGTLTTAKIFFAPSGTTVPTGYTLNDGTTNWVTEATAGTATPTALPMKDNTRNRTTTNNTATTDARQLGQLNMQCGTATDGKNCSTGTLTSGAFEYPVVNGKYTVTVSVGDAAADPTPAGTASTNQNSVHVINAEGTAVVTAFTPSGTTNATNFSVKTATVTVNDGKLTVDAKGGKNTKINYIDITPAP